MNSYRLNPKGRTSNNGSYPLVEASNLSQKRKTRQNKKNASENSNKKISKKNKRLLGLKSLPSTSRSSKNPSAKSSTKRLSTTRSESPNSAAKLISRTCSIRTRAKSSSLKYWLANKLPNTTPCYKLGSLNSPKKHQVLFPLNQSNIRRV